MTRGVINRLIFWRKIMLNGTTLRKQWSLATFDVDD